MIRRWLLTRLENWLLRHIRSWFADQRGETVKPETPVKPVTNLPPQFKSPVETKGGKIV